MSQKYKKYIIYILIITTILVVGIGLYYYNINDKNLSLKNEGVVLDNKNFEQELQDILEMQRSEGPLSILKKDCKQYSLSESKEYCEEQQKLFSDIVNE